MNKNRRLATAIVKDIMADFTDRRGLRQEWEGIDEDIRREIREEWIKLAEERIAKATPEST